MAIIQDGKASPRLSGTSRPVKCLGSDSESVRYVFSHGIRAARDRCMSATFTALRAFTLDDQKVVLRQLVRDHLRAGLDCAISLSALNWGPQSNHGVRMKQLAIALAIAASAVGAQAATVSFEYGLPIVTTTTEISQTGSLGLFDSALGTLTGATLTTSAGAVFSFTGTNTAAQAQSAKLTSSTDLSWTTTLGAVSSFLDSISLSATSNVQNYAVGETKSFGPLSDAGTDVNNLSTILASLQQAGGGTFNLTCTSLSGLTVQGGGGNINTTQATEAGCGAQIVYEYTVTPPRVPEPASLALVGLALAGIAATRRRKA